MKQLLKAPVRIFLMSSILVAGSFAGYAQVKVGANPGNITPNAVLDVEGTSAQRTVILQNGNMGVNQAAPTNKLHVKDAADPVKIEGLQVSTSASDKSVVVDANGVLKTTTSGATTAFVVATTTLQEYTRGAIGTTTLMKNEAEVVNSIPGLSYDQATNKLTIPAGVYIMNFTMNGSIKTSGQTAPIHSYFFDFPGSRIHANQPSNVGSNSSHGVNINYVYKATASTTITVAIGWGDGGNMAAGDVIYVSGSQLSLTRIAD